MKDKKERFVLSKPMILLIVGLAAGLILIFIGNGEKSTSSSTEQQLEEVLQITDKYITELEGRICTILESMDGISDVSVIITAKECAEIVYAQNSRYSDGSLTEKEYVMADESGMPIKIKLVYPKIRGAAVVCRGGSNPINQERIVALLTSLLDINSSNVYVVS